MHKRQFNPLIFLLSFILMLGTVLGLQPVSVAAGTMDNGVTISATDDEGENILPMTAVEFEPGENAFEVLERATDRQDVELKSEEFEDMGQMIQKIGHLGEEETHYWSFITQGTTAQMGASSTEVEHGDNITFQFTSLENPAEDMNVTVSAVDADGNPVIEETDVTIANQSSAYDALYQAAGKQGANLDVSVSGDALTTIDQIGEAATGEDDEWNMTINAEPTDASPVQSKLTNGDDVQFLASPEDDDSAEDTPEEGSEEDEPGSEDGEEADNSEDESDQDGDNNDNSAGNEEDADADENEGSAPEDENAVDGQDSDENDQEENTSAVDVQNHIDELLAYADDNAELEYGAEWWIWSFAHLDHDIPDGYVDSIHTEVNEADGEFRAMELQKIIISLSLIGEDATDVEGYNLIDILEEDDFETGINGYVYGLLALDSGDYATSGDGFRETLIDHLLDLEKDGGGWALFGDVPTVDITAMVLTALAPYQDNPEVEAATDRAVDYLEDAQEDNGGFYEEFNGGDTSESVSQVIVALAALGIDPGSDTFTEEGGNLLEHLERFQHADGGYAHLIDDEYSLPMSTQQALLAYVAYDKFIQGEESVYAQPASDDEGGDQDEPEDPEPSEPGEDEKDPEPQEPGKDTDTPEDPSGQNPDKDEDDGKEDPSTDPSDTNGNDDDGGTGSDENEGTGDHLPETATPFYNYLAIGMLFIVTGVLLFIIKRRKAHSH